jgi:hypothetical protein
MNEQQLGFDPTISEVGGTRFMKITTKRQDGATCHRRPNEATLICGRTSDDLLESTSRRERVQVDPCCQGLMAVP